MNKYEITTEKKKKCIINSSLTLFKEKGFKDVSIKEIAALSHVSQVTIYNYFGSKEAVISECVNLIMHDILEKAEDILTQHIDFVKKIDLAFLLCTQEVSLSISKLFTKEALNDPALFDLLTKNINENKKIIYRKYIELGKVEKVIDSTIPTETFLNFIEAINKMGSELEFENDITTKISHIHQLFLYGVLGKPQTKL